MEPVSVNYGNEHSPGRLQYAEPTRRSQGMSDDKKKKSSRKYPPFWERFVPIALAILGIVVIGMMIVAVSVALGVFPGSV